MMHWLHRYTRWLHTRWPAGTVEKLPLVREDGSTNVPGLYVVGDLTGIPLLKFSVDTGTRAVRSILADPLFQKRDPSDDVLDLLVIGAGVSGAAAIAEARHAGLRCEVIEASQPFDTISNFPARKPIYTYPTDMTPAGALQFSERSAVKEGLLDELQDFLAKSDIVPRIGRVERVERRGGVLQAHLATGEIIRAHRVIVGIGRSGNFRKLGVPGESLSKVSNRLHDPRDHAKKQVLVVGGGDSALEAAIALAQSGAAVSLSYRKAEFSRPKPENFESLLALSVGPSDDDPSAQPNADVTTNDAGAAHSQHQRPGSVHRLMSSSVREIGERDVVITTAKGDEQRLPNDAVFLMIGREAPLDFFRRSGVRIRGEWTAGAIVSLILFFALCVFIYHWKSDAGFGLKTAFKSHHLFPFNLVAPDDPSSLLGTLRLSLQKPSFYYSLAYTACIVLFGIRRVRHRRTPYVTRQTISLAAIQILPLFLLPYILLPWMGHNGWFDSGIGRSLGDSLFPATAWDLHGREYWRSVGFILAWPLLPWNLFTDQPIAAWVVISLVQTFVIIPLIVWRWGKGAYCGWICSCGALAETMGDAHRHKMPHGPVWNRLNMIGQVFLVFAAVLLVVRVLGWIAPNGTMIDRAANTVFMVGLYGKDAGWNALPFPMNVLNYEWFVDLLWAGVFGVAFYFWFSGRVWCRFACPLAALMHIYARFSQFRIIPEKSKCISCNVCTSVCHQGIDVMNFANKGLPMEDPECVRCSACVQSCPTGVLQFGRVNRSTGDVIAYDSLQASPVIMAELTLNGARIHG